MNLQLRDTAWHLSVFDMATCDVDEVIASLAGETDSGTQRDAAFFICCLRALSSRSTSNTLNLLLRRYPPGLLLVELYSELRELCVGARFGLRVSMRETFPGICFMRVCFCVRSVCILVHIFVLGCESFRRHRILPLLVCWPVLWESVQTVGL